MSLPLPNRKANAFRSGFLLVMGCFIGGLLTHFVWNGSVSNETSLLATNSSVNAISENKHYLLHLASGETEVMNSALSRAETLVMNSSQLNPTTVEVIANSKGLDLLRSDVSPFKARIAALAEKNVLFIACARGIENLLESNQEVHLLPEAEYRYTAVRRIVDGLQGGASYEKIEI